jgi:DoxX-like family
VASRKVMWIGRVLSILVSLVFIFSSVMKLRGGPELAQGMDHLGLSARMVFPLAILELACVAIYLIPPTAVLGAVLLTGYLGGAILTHWRVGDPFYVQIILGLLIWLGIYLRENRLKPLMPIRTPTN